MNKMATNTESSNGDKCWRLLEVDGDLFSCQEDSSLCHCVSQDLHMGKGIATIFKKKFGGVQELKQQGKTVGEVAVLRKGTRNVYYLITKPKYFHKPTYATLTSSLTAMKTDCVANGVSSLCMPRIGCGLDGLDWAKVKDVVKDLFQDTGITVTVYSLGPGKR